MYGKLLNTIINIMFITYLLLLVSFYFLHEGVKENINNINYSTVDTVSTTGVFNVELYNNMKEKIFNYAGVDCNYTITIKYQVNKGQGVYETHFLKDTVNASNLYYPDQAYVTDYNKANPASTTSLEELLNKVDPYRIITVSGKNPTPFYKGDIITIYLEDQNQTLYGKLISAPFMGMLDNYIDFRIKSLKSSMVGRDANKLVNGYEVVDEINDASRDYQVQLVTEISSQSAASAKIYNVGMSYTETNTDEAKITTNKDTGVSTVGTYHIFGTLNYYRVWDDGGVTGTVNGILDAGDIVTFYQTQD